MHSSKRRKKPTMKIDNDHDDHDSSTSGGSPVDLAEARYRRAEKALGTAEEVLEEAETALASIDESDPKAFDRGLAKRTAALARRDELRDRVRFAERAVENAKERARAAERAALQRDLDYLAEHIRRGEQEGYELWFEFLAPFRELMALQADFAEKAAVIDVKLGNQPRRDRTYFGNIEVGSEVQALLRSAEVQREAQKAALEARAKKAKGE